MKTVNSYFQACSRHLNHAKKQTAQFRIAFLSILVAGTLNLAAQDWQGQAVNVLPLKYGAYSISVVNDSVAWAVAFDLSITSVIPWNHLIKVMRTTDGGATWEVHDVEEAMGRISFDIVAIDDTTAWITTQDYNNGAGRGLFKTTNGGESWIEKLHDVSAGIWVRFFDADHAICINSGRYRRTSDGGETWTETLLVPGFLSGQEFNLITSGSNTCTVIGDTVWFGTNLGRLFRSIDQGQNWEIFDLGFGSEMAVRTFSFRDSEHGLLIGSFNNSSLSFLFQTSDGGATWEVISDVFPMLLPRNISHVPGTDGTYFLSGTYGAAYTIDSGVTWEIVDSVNALRAIGFSSAQSGWICDGYIAANTEPALYKWTGKIPLDWKTRNTTHDITIFPNPAKDKLRIRSTDEKIQFIRITDIKGMVCRQFKYQPDANSTYDLSGILPGVYFVQLVGERSFVAKVIITD